MIRDWTIKIGVLGTSTIVEGSRQDIMIKVETIKQGTTKMFKSSRPRWICLRILGHGTISSKATCSEEIWTSSMISKTLKKLFGLLDRAISRTRSNKSKKHMSPLNSSRARIVSGLGTIIIFRVLVMRVHWFRLMIRMLVNHCNSRIYPGFSKVKTTSTINSTIEASKSSALKKIKLINWLEL